MQKVYDNIDANLKDGIRQELRQSHSADFCSGYFNLNGFDLLSCSMNEHLTGRDNSFCRILIGRGEEYQNSSSVMIEKFINKIRLGSSTEEKNRFERLKNLIKCKKIHIGFSRSNQIHAKLYLFHHRRERIPYLAIVGSGNLTYNGLVRSKELNLVTTEKEACITLQKWFNTHWEQKSSIDISRDIAWSSYREIEENDLYLLASICDDNEVICFIDSAGNKFDIPGGFSYDRKGIEEGLNPDFEEAIRRVAREIGLDEMYFPTKDLYSERSVYDGMSIADCLIENFINISDPDYISSEVWDHIQRSVSKDNT